MKSVLDTTGSLMIPRALTLRLTSIFPAVTAFVRDPLIVNVNGFFLSIGLGEVVITALERISLDPPQDETVCADIIDDPAIIEPARSAVIFIFEWCFQSESIRKDLVDRFVFQPLPRSR